MCIGAQAHTRLASLLADVSLFDQAAASLEDAIATLASGTTYQEKAELQRRQREYRALAQRRRPPDHAKLMGLSSKATPDEVNSHGRSGVCVRCDRAPEGAFSKQVEVMMT